MKARIKFSKTGAVKFIGHLDLMRYFQKAMRRSNFPIAYTGGMSPHMIMSFAAPLGIGITSEGEYLDIGLDRFIEPGKAVEVLNSVMTEGIRVLSFQILDESEKSGMALVSAADYLVRFSPCYHSLPDWMDQWTDFMSRPVCSVIKETNAETKKINIRPLIYLWSLPSDTLRNDAEHMIFMQTASGSRNNLKPECVMEAFCRFTGNPYSQDDFRVHRLEIYKDMIINGTRYLTGLDGSRCKWTEESLS